MNLIDHFMQWVAHMMDAHWRRKTVAVRKRHNIKEGKLAHKTDNVGKCCGCDEAH